MSAKIDVSPEENHIPNPTDEVIHTTLNPVEVEHGLNIKGELFEMRENTLPPIIVGEKLLNIYKRRTGYFPEDTEIISRRRAKAADEFRSATERLTHINTGRLINEAYSSYPLPEKIAKQAASEGGLVEMLATASDEEIEEFVVWNADFITSINENEGEQLAEEFEHAKSLVRAFITNSRIPVNTDAIEKKLARVTVGYADPFTSTDIGGYYHNHEEYIGVKPITGAGEDAKKARLQAVLVHEILHSLSGRLVVGKHYQWLEDDESSVELQHAGYSRWSWLNEAVTEQITRLALSGSTFDYEKADFKSFLPLELASSGAYRGPRLLLGAVTCGIEKAGLKIIKPLVSGYFEDYEPAKEAGKRNPKWAEAVQKIVDYIGPGQMRELEKLFRRGLPVENFFERNSKDAKIMQAILGEGPKTGHARSSYEVRKIRAKRRELAATRLAGIEQAKREKHT